ncbi:MAG: phenylalanine--tRNA ligase subunit alpha [Candidatus Woesearchaeota archaeon]|nr:phenylalanine--tRNA ligase subunit alpha [Candidatus Woesearchaeota archaeon]
MGVAEGILAQLHPLEVKLLPHLANGTLSALAQKAGMQEVEAMRACQWLANKKALSLEPLVTHELSLDVNGKNALKNGLPELRFLDAIKKGAKTTKAIGKTLSKDELGVSMGICKKNKWISLGKTISLTATGKNIKELPEGKLLKKISKGILEQSLSKDEQVLVKKLRSRKQYLIVKEKRDRTVKLTALGKELKKTDIKKLTFDDSLTAEDLKTGAWKKKKYRAYDVTINVPRIPAGKIHFVQEAINYIRKIWVEMGFSEMTGDCVQTGFWDLDSLFVPQDHPAREMQDTFYLETAEPIDRLAYEKVSAAHEHGGTTGSKGWRYEFSKKISEKQLLRTHNTVLSAQTLWKIRNGEAKMPGKYFAVGPVFRNEKLDWKHLFEFNQVEGIVVDKDVTFAQLLGYLRTFFGKMGFPDIRTRPSYFPYVSCGCEVDVWNPRKKQWVELGGSGIFRPEVTKPLIGEEVPVLAWGLGMERIIVEYFGFTDLRDLYKNDIKQLREMKRFMKMPVDTSFSTRKR